MNIDRKLQDISMKSNSDPERQADDWLSFNEYQVSINDLKVIIEIKDHPLRGRMGRVAEGGGEGLGGRVGTDFLGINIINAG